MEVITWYQCSCCSEAGFRTPDARDDHEKAVHYYCAQCPAKFHSWTELKTHCIDRQCHYVCEGCGDQGAIWRSGQAFRNHLRDDNVCNECEKHHDKYIDLAYHERTHRYPLGQCAACPATFTTYAAMIMHVESDTCPSGMGEADLILAAAECPRWHMYFIFPEDRITLLAGEHVVGIQRERARPCQAVFFKCPTCQVRFPKLSNLFLHVATPACPETLGAGVFDDLWDSLTAKTLRNADAIVRTPSSRSPTLPL